MSTYLRNVWKYQTGNQNPYIERQTAQWPNKKDNRTNTDQLNITHKTKDRVTRMPLSNGGWTQVLRKYMYTLNVYSWLHFNGTFLFSFHDITVKKDCELGEWGDWTKPFGFGTIERVKMVKRREFGNGAPCPVVRQTRAARE